MRDFAAVSQLTIAPGLTLVVGPRFPARNIAEFIALAKSKDGNVSFGSPGVGNTLHLAGELLNISASAHMLHVPYKGAAPALADVLGGQLAIMFIAGPPALGHIKSGKLRTLGVTSSERLALVADVPTIAESGYPGFEIYDWEGILGPAGMPAAVVSKLNAEVNRVVTSPEIKQRIADQGATAGGGSAADLGDRIKREIVLWHKIVKETGMAIE